ncbi:MAG: heavy-metal-associated domain-containing protein [Gammaproteobacteria bacterium]|nr:heavy-metal-associated domain-containing protein [Gammaproteobacteria bacterium]
MKTEFHVQGMTCGGCERSIKNALTGLGGVLSATADRNTGTVVVEHDPARIAPAALSAAIGAAGFEVTA